MLGLYVPSVADGAIASDLERTYWWRVMIFFPLIFVIMRIITLLTVFNYDTPRHYVLVGKDEEAKKIIEEIYLPEYQD
jgi:hypothetical protein